jgi:hypothetical protein
MLQAISASLWALATARQLSSPNWIGGGSMLPVFRLPFIRGVPGEALARLGAFGETHRAHAGRKGQGMPRKIG